MGATAAAGSPEFVERKALRRRKLVVAVEQRVDVGLEIARIFGAHPLP
jgi:hypothetical protein